MFDFVGLPYLIVRLSSIGFLFNFVRLDIPGKRNLESISILKKIPYIIIIKMKSYDKNTENSINVVDISFWCAPNLTYILFFEET